MRSHIIIRWNFYNQFENKTKKNHKRKIWEHRLYLEYLIDSYVCVRFKGHFEKPRRALEKQLRSPYILVLESVNPWTAFSVCRYDLVFFQSFGKVVSSFLHLRNIVRMMLRIAGLSQTQHSIQAVWELGSKTSITFNYFVYLLQQIC